MGRNILVSCDAPSRHPRWEWPLVDEAFSGRFNYILISFSTLGRKICNVFATYSSKVRKVFPTCSNLILLGISPLTPTPPSLFYSFPYSLDDFIKQKIVDLPSEMIFAKGRILISGHYKRQWPCPGASWTPPPPHNANLTHAIREGYKEDCTDVNGRTPGTGPDPSRRPEYR